MTAFDKAWTVAKSMDEKYSELHDRLLYGHCYVCGTGMEWVLGEQTSLNAGGGPVPGRITEEHPEGYKQPPSQVARGELRLVRP
jgi:hypothetical protein|tara:strand:+ start:149 stop:400 length:252 start_codon:yes stop_codon:yes gene_type:complete